MDSGDAGSACSDRSWAVCFPFLQGTGQNLYGVSIFGGEIRDLPGFNSSVWQGRVLVSLNRLGKEEFWLL